MRVTETGITFDGNESIFAVHIDGNVSRKTAKTMEIVNSK
jgi:hypothetical protein